MRRFEFSYRSVLESEEQMLDDVTTALNDLRTEDALKQHLLLVICEAFNNALVHGNRLDPEKGILVCLEVNEGCLTADIIDQGHGGLKRILERGKPEPLATHGRGIALMEHYARRVSFVETPDGHLRVSMRFEFHEAENICKS